VFGVHGKPVVGQGSFAEAVVATTGTLAHRPDDLDAAFAAALPVAGVSALELVDFVHAGAGDVVVVLGASGGIGGYVVPMLVAEGATVVGVAGAPNHRYVRDLGAAVVLDYRGHDVAEEVRALYPDGAAAVIDLAGDRELATHASELLGEGGRFASMLGGADVDALAAREVTGTNVRTQITTAKLERLAALVESGTLKRPTIVTRPLEEAGRALAECANRHVRGKLVIVP